MRSRQESGERQNRSWRRYLRFWGPRATDDVDDELQYHIEMRVRDYVAQGFDEATARATVMERLGNVASIRAECVQILERRDRKAARDELISSVAQDARFAARILVRQKGWSAAAVLTLALGIGASAAVFSIVDRLILNPLPYPDARRVVVIYQEMSGGQMRGRVAVQPPVARAWLAQARSFESVEAVRSADLAMAQVDQPPARVHAAFVSATFGSFAGESPLIGRMFNAREASEGASLAVLGEGTWRTTFGADSTVIGKTLTLNDRNFTIIGVARASLRLPRVDQARIDVWLPLRITDGMQGLSLVGRLREGISIEAAARDLDAIEATLELSGPDFRPLLIPPEDLLSFRDPLLLTAVAVALVLLIACANVAHLYLARNAARQREFGIRVAIGATRTRVIRQLLTESLLLAALGCGAGLVLAALVLRVVIAIRPVSLDALRVASLDAGAFAVAVVLTLLAGVGSGVWGAVGMSRHAVASSPGARVSASLRQKRTRSALVVSQMALTTTLLVCSTLLVRSVIHLQSADPGFAPRDLYEVSLRLPARYGDAERSDFFLRLLERTRSLPGVEAATIASGAPPSFHGTSGVIQVEGDAAPPIGAAGMLKTNDVEQGYFHVMGIRLIEGTTFTDTSRQAGQLVVNRGLARKYWAGQSAIGRRLRIVAPDGRGDWLTVVGVVDDAATAGLTENSAEPMLYRPTLDMYSPSVLLRAQAGVDIAAEVRALVRSMDQRLIPPTLVKIEAAMARTAERPRFTMALLAAFSVVALVLAAVGLYGVMAYTVTQRTREIGIRIALGATRLNVGRSIVVNGLSLAVIGMVLGAVGALWGSRLLESLLFGVTRSDPASVAVAVTILGVTTCAACVIPSSRAARVDPTVAMRSE